jgi:hypothetical protein
VGAAVVVLLLKRGAEIVGGLELEGDHAGLDSLGLRVQQVIQLLVHSLQAICDVIFFLL